MTDPFTTMNEGAIAAHEMFLSLKKAGFTQEEALELVLGVLVAGAGGKS